MTTTYTIACDDESGMLLAVCRDDKDIEAALSNFERQADVQIDRQGLTIEAGLRLTDDEEGGCVVFIAGRQALEDEYGRSYKYAVR